MSSTIVITVGGEQVGYVSSPANVMHGSLIELPVITDTGDPGFIRMSVTRAYRAVSNVNSSQLTSNIENVLGFVPPDVKLSHDHHLNQVVAQWWCADVDVDTHHDLFDHDLFHPLEHGGPYSRSKTRFDMWLDQMEKAEAASGVPAVPQKPSKSALKSIMTDIMRRQAQSNRPILGTLGGPIMNPKYRHGLVTTTS